MKAQLKPLPDFRAKRQGQIFAFTMTGAMALALTACNKSDSDSGQPMIAPPAGYSPYQATLYTDTNQPPTNANVCASSNCGGYLSGHGYYRVYGYPGYYYRPAPGSTVEIVNGGSSTYQAGSPEEADESARGGFGGEGEGEGGEGGHGFGGGEGGGE